MTGRILFYATAKLTPQGSSAVHVPEAHTSRPASLFAPSNAAAPVPLKHRQSVLRFFNHLVTLPSYRFAWEIVVSNISVSDVMALRSAVLDRNSALRNVVNSSAASPASAGGIARPTFDC